MISFLDKSLYGDLIWEQQMGGDWIDIEIGICIKPNWGLKQPQSTWSMALAELNTFPHFWIKNMEYKPFRIPSSHPSKPSPQQEGVSIRAYETFTIYMGCFTLGLRLLCFRNNHRRCFEFLATVTTGVLFLSRALKPPVVFIATSVVLWLLWAIFQCRRRWLWWEWPRAGWPWFFCCG